MAYLRYFQMRCVLVQLILFEENKYHDIDDIIIQYSTSTSQNLYFPCDDLNVFFPGPKGSSSHNACAMWEFHVRSSGLNKFQLAIWVRLMDIPSMDIKYQ